MALSEAGAMALSGGLQAASGFFGGLITNYGKQRRSQQKLNAWNFENITKPQMEIEQEYNQRNMALQNDYQIQAENRANAYNDPSAQLARARQANMNPQVVMSDAGVQGSISSAPDSSSPSVSSPSGGSAGTKDYSFLGKMDIAGAILSARKAVQEYENAKQQQKNQNDLTVAEVNVKNAEAARLRGQEGRDSALFTDIQRRNKALADTAEEQAEVARLDKEFIQAVQNMRIDKFEVELDNARKDGKIKDEIFNNYVAQTVLVKANRGLVLAQTETEKSRKENVEQDTDTKKSQESLNVSQTNLNWESWQGKRIENDIMRFKNEVKEIDWTADKLFEIADLYLKWKGLNDKERADARDGKFKEIGTYANLLAVLARFI